MKALFSTLLISSLIMMAVAENQSEYNAVLSKELMNNISRNLPLSYFHTLIKGNISLSQHMNRAINSSIEIRNSIIDGQIDFHGYEFYDDVKFIDTTFANITNLNDTYFKKNVEFINCTFNKNVYFGGSGFQRNANFGDSRFREESIFTNSRFKNYCGFKHTQFFGPTDFQNSEFNRTEFNGANFSDNVHFDFCKFNIMADFTNCNFSKGAWFYQCDFMSINFLRARVTENINLRYSKFSNPSKFNYFLVSGNTDLSKCEFKGPADFWDSTFVGSVNLNESLFEGDALFQRASFKKPAYFAKSKFIGIADFSETNFGDIVDFSDCLFNDSTKFIHSTFDKYVSFKDALFRRNILADDGKFNGIINLNRTSYAQFFVRWQSIHELKYNETAYNTLIKNFKNIGLFEDANKCYYTFMWEQANQTTREVFGGKIQSSTIFYSIIYFLSWILYGFGVRPEFPIIWSLILIIGVFTPFWYINLEGTSESIFEKYGPTKKQKEKVSLGYALKLSSSIFLSGTKIFIDPPKIPERSKGSKPWINRMYLLERTLGAAFFFLFFLAISKTIISS